MKLENQLTNLELSKRMKELGFPQKSLFWWAMIRGKGVVLGHYGFTDDQFIETEHYSAYSVAELGEMFPQEIETKKLIKLKIDVKWKESPTTFVTFGSEHCGCEWECGSEKMLEHTFTDKFEVNARAKMLIYLAENNLIKPK